MEEVLWMLEEASIPIVVGLVMAASLSPLSHRSASQKRNSGILYLTLILLSLFVGGFQPDAPLHNIAFQLQGGVSAAFGIGIAMSTLRLGETWKDRVSGALFLTLFVAFVWLTFDSEIGRALHYLTREGA